MPNCWFCYKDAGLENFHVKCANRFFGTNEIPVLASSAMHLVKKGELMTKLKSELNQVIKGLDNPIAIEELKKMIRSLSEDDKMDKEWENFIRHFDKVHSDFVIGLKEKHPTISACVLCVSFYSPIK